jgi:hypothetical protein
VSVSCACSSCVSSVSSVCASEESLSSARSAFYMRPSAPIASVMHECPPWMSCATGSSHQLPPCVFPWNTMEKQTSPAGDVEQTATSQPPASPRRASKATGKRLAIAVVVAVFLQLGYLLRHPLSHLLQSASCHHTLGQLTIEQRAHKILRENPLIGQANTCTHAGTKTNPIRRWPQRPLDIAAYALQEPYIW